MVNKKLPKKVYIEHKHRANGHITIARDFFVLKGSRFKKQGYDMPDCRYAEKFLKKYPNYKYAFSDDNAHFTSNGKQFFETSSDGWVNVTNKLKNKY